MNDEHMLMYALVFVLGFMVARMMSGRLVEGEGVETNTTSDCTEYRDTCLKEAEDMWLDWYQYKDDDGKLKKRSWGGPGSTYYRVSTAVNKVKGHCYDEYEKCGV
jgi:hypothetical protein